MAESTPSNISIVGEFSTASEISMPGRPRKSLLKRTNLSTIELAEDEERPAGRRGLQWNVAATTWTDELRQIREEIQRRKLEAPGMKLLITIPKDRFHHWQFNYEDMNYYPYGLDLSHMNVQDIRVISTLKHLTFLDLSHNNMTNESLGVISELKLLNYLNLDHNQFASMDIAGTSNVRWFSIRNNAVVWVEPFTMPLLEYAHLDNNLIKFIENFDEENTPLLRLLSIKGNRLVTTKDCKLSASVKYLYMGENKVRNIDGIEHCVNLRVLHLRDCKIKKLKTLLPFVNLYYLNLSLFPVMEHYYREVKELTGKSVSIFHSVKGDNYVAHVRQFKKLRSLKHLRVVVTTGCPFEKENPDKGRLGVIYCLMYLKRVNKLEVNADDIDDAKKLRDEIEADDESSEDDVPEETNEYTDNPVTDKEKEEEQADPAAVEAARLAAINAQEHSIGASIQT